MKRLAARGNLYRRNRRLWPSGLALLMGCMGCSAPSIGQVAPHAGVSQQMVAEQPPATHIATNRPEVTAIDVLTLNGGRLDWSPDGSLLVIDRYGEDGLLDVYTMTPDGTEERCLTCDHTGLGLPIGHKGNPEWHPDGRWIVFQAEMAQHPGEMHGYETKPGAGYFNELWAIKSDGSEAHRLYGLGREILANRAARGTLHPHFDADGTRLTWSHLVRGPKLFDPNLAYGEYRIRVAPFRMERGIPRLLLGQMEEYIPGVPAFYETHGFSPDGRAILFSGNPDRDQKTFGIDIAVMDLNSRQIVRRVTNTPYIWDEHAHYGPTERRILYASSRGLRISREAVHADYWIAEEDGSSWQFTRFNDPRWPLRPSTIPPALFTADGDFSPDGRRFAAYLIIGDSRAQQGAIVVVHLSGPL